MFDKVVCDRDRCEREVACERDVCVCVKDGVCVIKLIKLCVTKLCVREVCVCVKNMCAKEFLSDKVVCDKVACERDMCERLCVTKLSVAKSYLREMDSLAAWMSPSAKQKKRRCHQVPRLPCKWNVDVAKCHARHAKCRGATGD